MILFYLWSGGRVYRIKISPYPTSNIKHKCQELFSSNLFDCDGTEDPDLGLFPARWQLSAEARSEMRSEDTIAIRDRAPGRHNIFGYLHNSHSFCSFNVIYLVSKLKYTFHQGNMFTNMSYGFFISKVCRQTNINSSVSQSFQYPDYYELPSNPLFPLNTHLLSLDIEAG